MDLFTRVYLPAAIAPDVPERNDRSTEQQLASLRFTTTEPPPMPTILGVMVLGQDPREFVPCAYVQFCASMEQS